MALFDVVLAVSVCAGPVEEQLAHELSLGDVCMLHMQAVQKGFSEYSWYFDDRDPQQ